MFHMLEISFTYFSIITILIITMSAVFVVLLNNSIQALVCLIICFSASAVLLLVLEAEFFSILFIIIYVGAIAVLFLFVIMMLDLKISPNRNSSNTKYSMFGVFVTVSFLHLINQTLNYYYQSTPYDGEVLIPLFYKDYFKEDDISEIVVIGQILYTQYVLQFLIAGVLLTLAVIGVCVLTLSRNEFKTSSKPKLRKW